MSDIKKQYQEQRAKLAAQKATYKRHVDKEISIMSNDKLLESYIELQGGDDYDGCFTTRGDVRFKAFSRELFDRLYKIGFLDNPM